MMEWKTLQLQRDNAVPFKTSGLIVFDYGRVLDVAPPGWKTTFNLSVKTWPGFACVTVVDRGGVTAESACSLDLWRMFNSTSLWEELYLWRHARSALSYFCPGLHKSWKSIVGSRVVASGSVWRQTQRNVLCMLPTCFVRKIITLEGDEARPLHLVA